MMRFPGAGSRRALVLMFFVALAGTGGAGAASGAPQAIDLDGAVRAALEDNPALRGDEAALAASRWRSRGSALAFLPTGSFASSVTRVDGRSLDQANQAQSGLTALFEGLTDLGVPGLDDVAVDPFLYRDTFRSRFTVNQEFPLNLHLLGGRRLASAGLRLANGEFASARDALVRDVRLAFFDLLAARELLAVAEEGLAAAENRKLLAEEREALGMINRSERLLWDVAAAQARSDLAAARTGQRLTEMELNRLLGRPLDSPLAPAPVAADALARGRRLAAMDLMDLADVAASSSPLARVLDAGDDLSGAGRQLAFAGLVPSLHFSFSYGWRENQTLALDDYETWSATALLNVPLFDLAARWTDYRSAAAEERRQHYRGEDNRARLRQAVAAAWHGVRLAEETLMHRETARDQADETLALMRDRYALGHIAEFDLVDVQTAATAARAAAVRARYDQLGALATLESLLGGAVDENEE